MRGRLPWVIGVLVAVAIVAAVGGATWLLDDDEDSPDETELAVATSPVGQSLPAPSSPAAQTAAVDELEEFWTVDRVVEALDNPTPRPEGEGEPEPAPSTPSGNAPGAGADAQADGKEPVVREGTPKAAAGVQRACSQPPLAAPQLGFSYKRFCYRGRLSASPARTSGALIFWDDANSDGRVDAGEQGACSATVAASRNESVLVTAGHCVVKTAVDTSGQPRWFKSFAFVPSHLVEAFYRAAESQNGSLAQFARRNLWFGLPIAGSGLQAAWSPEAWVSARRFSGDFAAIVMAPRVRGGSRQTIQDVLGSQGWDMTGRLTPGSVRLLGYPADNPFNGRVLFECRGTSKLVRIGNDPVPELAVGCDMTGGSSGGPWLVAVDRRGVGKVVSVNSHGPRNIMVGPRLSSLHIDAMRKAETTTIAAR
jgi:hypothetical protein